MTDIIHDNLRDFHEACALAGELSAYITHSDLIAGRDENVAKMATFLYAVQEWKRRGVDKAEMHGLVEWAFSSVDVVNRSSH